MRRSLGFLRATLFIAVAALVAQAAPIQTESPACKTQRRNLSALLETAKSKPPIEQYRDLNQFVSASLDDSGNCATLDALDSLNVLERQLVSLAVSGHPVPPQQIFYCNAVDPKTQHCSGIQADDSALIPESEIGRPRPTFPRWQSQLSIDVLRGFYVALVSAYGGPSSALDQDHPHPLAKLDFHDFSVDIRKLQKIKHPVIVIVFRAEDQLHFRKAVWRF